MLNYILAFAEGGVTIQWNIVGLSVAVMAGMAVVLGAVILLVNKFCHVETDPKIDEIYENLPHANCGGCGYAGCSDFAKALAEGLTKRGINLVSGGTDNHLMLVDLRSVGITGKELEHRLDEVHITANKNAIPNDPEKPFVTSGVRLGTPAVTTRGLGVEDMDKIAEFIYLCATDFENKKDYIKNGVAEICKKYPLYE